MNIFYLEWTNKRPTLCEFRRTIPDKFNFQCSVNIKGLDNILTEIKLYGLIDSELKNYSFDVSPYRKRAFLVSHLQKSIRKMKDVKSIKTAKHLIDLDISSLLRRLPIIMFEDVIPHDSLPILIWLMIAVTKKFQIKNVMVQWLLGVVYFLSSCKDHDKVHKIDTLNPNIINSDKIQENIFLRSILIRISYGGMKGDMQMLKYFMQFWYKKMNNNEQINNSKIQYINHNLGNLFIQEWDLCANDFHCNPKLIQIVKKQYNLYSEDFIKKLIWEYSSRENKRIKYEINEDEYKDWLIIKKFVRFQQKNMNFH